VSDEPDVSVIELDPVNDYFVILACDGLWDVCSDQEAVNLLLEGLTEFRNLGLPSEFPQKGEICARMLVEEALLRGSADNVTVQVVFFS